MIFWTDHDGGDYVDLVGTPDEPRASVGRIVLDGRLEDYRHDLARRSRPVRPEEARAVAKQLARLHPSQRRRSWPPRAPLRTGAQRRVRATRIAPDGQRAPIWRVPAPVARG